MRIFKRRPSTVGAVLVSAAATALLVLPASPASAATFTNACTNSITANNSQLDVTMTADSPASVAPNGSVALTNIDQTLGVPSSVFIAGYNLGILTTGENTIPGEARTTIEGTNTVEGVQTTNAASGSITTTITDPDALPGSGDEAATPGVLPLTYDNQTWTAAATGNINFREDTRYPTSSSNYGILVTATVGILPFQFRCSPGTVTGPEPGVVTQIDPAASFASTLIEGTVNQAPTADAGPDQTVASGASVNLDGTGSSDPDGDTLTYDWTQASGPAVTLSGANTATPSFTAPAGPATLVFENEVCDSEPLCDTDSVTVNSFALGEPNKDKKKGTAKLPVEVPGEGDVVLEGTEKVKPDAGQATEAEKVKLCIAAKGDAKKKLKKKGSVKVTALVTYTPTGGPPTRRSRRSSWSRSRRYPPTSGGCWRGGPAGDFLRARRFVPVAEPHPGYADSTIALDILARHMLQHGGGRGVPRPDRALARS